MTDSTQDPKPRLSKALRFQILRRDNHACLYCGAAAPDVKLTVDHVVPRSLGGTNDPSNLATACASCNTGKAGTPPDAPLVEDVKESELRWMVAREQAAAVMSRQHASRRAYCEAFLIEWNSYRWGAKDEYSNPLPDNWETSVCRLHDYLLPEDVMLACVRIACGYWGLPAERVFRYFVGCSNKRIAELHDTARAILDADDLGGLRGPHPHD